jgi:hypothetical protein
MQADLVGSDMHKCGKGKDVMILCAVVYHNVYQLSHMTTCDYCGYWQTSWLHHFDHLVCNDIHLLFVVYEDGALV